MNYLELCQEFVAEVGIAGGSIGSVVAQTGELGNVVRWARDADMYVALLWQDWRFLWFQHEPALIADTLVPALTSSRKAQKWRRKLKNGSSAFFLNREATDWTTLTYVPWNEFHGTYDVGVIATRRPSIITERPDLRLVLDTIPDDDYTLSAECWLRPTPMSANTSLPNVPEDFYRLLIARMMIFYGGREDAPELIAAGEAEYIDLLEKLEARELAEGFRHARSSEDDDFAHMETDLL